MRKEKRGVSDEPFSDSFKLFRIVDSDVYSEMHTLLHQVHVETGDLGSSDSSLHSCEKGWRSIQDLSREEKFRLTLTSYSTVESVSLNKD